MSYSFPRRVTREGADTEFALVADDKAFGEAQAVCKNGRVYTNILADELIPLFRAPLFLWLVKIGAMNGTHSDLLSKGVRGEESPFHAGIGFDCGKNITRMRHSK